MICGTTNHAGPEWRESAAIAGDPKPCTHCGQAVAGFDVYQFAWSSDGPLCFGLCRYCYLGLVATFKAQTSA